jgi:hypothetical protein
VGLIYYKFGRNSEQFSDPRIGFPRRLDIPSAPKALKSKGSYGWKALSFKTNRKKKD